MTVLYSFIRQRHKRSLNEAPKRAAYNNFLSTATLKFPVERPTFKEAPGTRTAAQAATPEHMKRTFFTLLLFYAASNASGQTVLGLEKNIAFPDLRVEIADDISFPDFKIRIGQRVPFEDITVGITDSRARADFIISRSSFPDKRIMYGKSVPFEDLKICAGEQVNFPDLTIEVTHTGPADYWIYSEKGQVSHEEIVLCLIEVIKEKVKKEK